MSVTVFAIWAILCCVAMLSMYAWVGLGAALGIGAIFGLGLFVADKFFSEGFFPHF